ncbi:unnamed protein product, partial [Meganyctiphanes norvegica]
MYGDTDDPILLMTPLVPNPKIRTSVGNSSVQCRYKAAQPILPNPLTRRARVILNHCIYVPDEMNGKTKRQTPAVKKNIIPGIFLPYLEIIGTVIVQEGNSMRP